MQSHDLTLHSHFKLKTFVNLHQVNNHINNTSTQYNIVSFSDNIVLQQILRDFTT